MSFLLIFLFDKYQEYLILAFSLIMLALSFKIKFKTNIKYTKRLIRLICSYCVVCVILLVTLEICLKQVLLAFIITYIFLPLLLASANLINLPIEKHINNYYIKKAKTKICSSKAISIAIVGSYGKTSVKNILYKMLSQKYNCVVTPSSYNTPLGIAKFVNTTSLDCDYCIYEMGAKRLGDISYLCQMVKPKFAIITGIDTCHLETFKSIENIIKAKGEVLDYLEQNDLCIINSDCNNCKEYLALGKCQKFTAGEKGELSINNISCSYLGSNFTIKYQEISLPCQTKLLGKHNLTNIALSSMLALKLGVNTQDIAKTCLDLTPTLHRLSLTKVGNITVIDDSYNANLSGVEALCQTLDLFDGKKMAISQGIVEVGSASYDINFKVGQKMSLSVDLLVVIGKNSQAISQGYATGNKVAIKAKNLQDAVKICQAHYSTHSTLVFQNDLPDNL
ncbi:MAG: UDP-N-acetylmuramoyl-tripeptide--D-alanyl-D-alanine ligase [Clostridia bacterium]